MKRVSTQFYALPLTVVVTRHLCYACCVLSPELYMVNEIYRLHHHLSSDGAACN